MSLNTRALAQHTAAAATTSTSNSGAAPAAQAQRKVWSEWLDRERPRDSDGWFRPSMGMVTIGSPVVHFANLDLTQGIASLGMRLVSGSLFVLAVGSSDERDGIGIGLLGVLATAIVVVVDATLFAWKEHPRKTRAAAWLTAWIDPRHGRLGLGYTANF